MSFTPVRLLLLDTAVVSRCNRSPFLIDSDCALRPHAGAAATVYRVKHPGDTSTTKYAKFSATGAQTAYAMPATMNALSTAAVTDANRLRTVVLVNGSPIVRVDSAPAAGQFYSADTTHVNTGSTYAAGTKVEVIAMDAADITNTGSIAAGKTLAEVSQSFYTATAKCDLVAAARG